MRAHAGLPARAADATPRHDVAGQAMSLGHTLVITEDGREVLSRLTPEYHVRG